MQQTCGTQALQLQLMELWSHGLPALFCILHCIMIVACRIAAGDKAIDCLQCSAYITES